ncbi:hypothetical protein GCM10010271_41740 [Streptomyces kurssanovii]|nr:hypothetical protein GCM10010271_41740 [Streptomyces kurssanovii]
MDPARQQTAGEVDDAVTDCRSQRQKCTHPLTVPRWDAVMWFPRPGWCTTGRSTPWLRRGLSDGSGDGRP